MSARLTRRDRCYLVGKRALTLTDREAAWRIVAELLNEEMAERDVPKFEDLIGAIRGATIGIKFRYRNHPVHSKS